MPEIVVLSDGQTFDLKEYTETLWVNEEELDRIQRGERIDYVLQERDA